MKSINCLILFIASMTFSASKTFGQVKTYDAQWKKVDELIQKKNLPKSALAEVKNIYTNAKAGCPDHQNCSLYDRSAAGKPGEQPGTSHKRSGKRNFYEQRTRCFHF